MRNRALIAAIAALMLVLAGCSDAGVASRNLSKSADQFEILRRVVFVNGITDEYLLEIQGYCSIEDQGDVRSQLEVTCKVDHDQYKKHFLGLSDNVTYFVEQMDAANVDSTHYRVIFKPATIVPFVDVES